MRLTLDDRIQRAVIWALRLSLLISMAIEIAIGSWELLFLSVLTLLLTYIPRLIERRYRIDLPIEFEIVIVLFIYAAIALGSELDFYKRFWWWDTLLHTVSGIVLGFVGFLILYILYHQKKLQARPATLAVFAFCFSLAGGAVWELFEFSVDKVFGTNMQKSGLPDTMGDLAVDGLGALLVSLTGYFYLKNPSSGPLHRFIGSFLTNNPRLNAKEK